MAEQYDAAQLTGSVTKGAGLRDISHASLTTRMRILERELGCFLLIRDSEPVLRFLACQRSVLQKHGTPGLLL